MSLITRFDAAEAALLERVGMLESAVDALRREIGTQLDRSATQTQEGIAKQAEQLQVIERRYDAHRRTMDWYVSTGAVEIQRSTLAIMQLLRPQRAKGFGKIRIGSANDGGYVSLDDFSSLDTAFSFGVERNADWDLAVANRGLTVYQFDHSIDVPPINDSRLIWEKKKIAPQAGPGQESVSSLLGQHDKGNERPNIILKMDIEGGEWDVINAIPDEHLGRFSQIVCEFHSFDYLGERWFAEKVAKAFQRLNGTYGVVHVHANNHCGFANVSGVMVPMVVELTFANRAIYALEESKEVFPGPLDRPCDPWRPDLFLGNFRFAPHDNQNEQQIDVCAATATSAELVARIGYKGDDENELYRAFVGDVRPITSPPARLPFRSTLCRQVHFTLDQYRFWCHALKDKPRFLRKQWEFVFIAQALFERGLLMPGKRGLAFGVGREPLPALFASFGVNVVASDQNLQSAIDAGWVRSGEHSIDLSALNDRHLCTPHMFEQLATFMEIDMTAIPTAAEASFDFCWSACSLEHLGSLQAGLDFIVNSINVLKPGGTAIHTTEFNMTSNDATIEARDLSIYRRRDIEALVGQLGALGHTVEPIDWTVGDGAAETVVDLPPYGRGEPHIRLRLHGYDCTSIGLIITKQA